MKKEYDEMSDEELEQERQRVEALGDAQKEDFSHLREVIDEVEK